MYATQSKPFKTRSFSTAKQDINYLPLEQFNEEYQAARSNALLDYQIEFDRLVEYEKDQFLKRWNATEESSYEGSFEELNIDSKVKAKLGSKPDPRTEPEVVAVLESFASKFAIPKNASWFFSQVIARIGQLPLVKNENGYSAKTLYLQHFVKDPQLQAIWTMMTHPKRSVLLEKQTSIEYRNYSSLVPIIMSAFKKLNGTPYSSWDRSEIFGITDPNLSAAMLVSELPEMTKEQVLAERDFALTPKSGAKMGITNNPATTYMMYFPKDSGLHSLPTLARIMMCQTWCAHPSNRTNYMILNPLDWDDMPEALVTGSVLRSSGTKLNSWITESGNPWE